MSFLLLRQGKSLSMLNFGQALIVTSWVANFNSYFNKTGYRMVL